MSDLYKLTSEDINKNSVNTINQFRVLAYLKSNLFTLLKFIYMIKIQLK